MIFAHTSIGGQPPRASRTYGESPGYDPVTILCTERWLQLELAEKEAEVLILGYSWMGVYADGFEDALRGYDISCIDETKRIRQ